MDWFLVSLGFDFTETEGFTTTMQLARANRTPNVGRSLSPRTDLQDVVVGQDVSRLLQHVRFILVVAGVIPWH